MAAAVDEEAAAAMYQACSAARCGSIQTEHFPERDTRGAGPVY